MYVGTPLSQKPATQTGFKSRTLGEILPPGVKSAPMGELCPLYVGVKILSSPTYFSKE
jgi:hypothetical protein